jgi:uncharacterized protein
MPGTQFQIKKNNDGIFFFNLINKDREIILSGDGFKTREDCINCVYNIKVNSNVPTRIVVKMAKAGQICYVLTTENGEIIGKSELYKSISKMESDIESVKRDAQLAEVKYFISEGIVENLSNN